MGKTGDTQPESARSHRRRDWTQVAWAVALTACVLLYRGLEFWANNAWDLASPAHIFIWAVVALVVVTLLLLAVSHLTDRVFTVAVILSWGLFLVFNWKSVDTPLPFLVVAGMALASLIGWLFLPGLGAPRIVGIIATVTVIAPMAQVITAHLREQVSFPVVESPGPGAPSPTGNVEDAFLLIVDGYPMDSVARNWFGHDTGSLMAELGRQGFETPSVSWSHNTFTALAIPSILEAEQVADLTQTRVWRNKRPLYEITRGGSFSAEAFRAAGFDYVDVESGWDGDECEVVDECIPSSFADEALWAMLQPSPISDLMRDRWGSLLALGSFHTVESLQSLDVFGDGAHQFVYAHLLLPHPPQVVDSQCNMIPEDRRGENPEQISHQLACVDRMVLDIVSGIPKNTAIVITGDHGTGTRGQLLQPPDEWDDLDLTERLGAFLAYRLPDGCAPPERNTNVYAMRAMLKCALTIDQPFNPASHILGEDVLWEIDVDRLDRIEASLGAGPIR